MISKSINGNSTEEVNAALQKSLAMDFEPTLAIAFIFIKQDRKTICEMHCRALMVNMEGP